MAEDLKNSRQQMRDDAKTRREIEKEKKAQARADGSFVGEDEPTIAERKAEIAREKSQKYGGNPAAEKNSGEAGSSHAGS